MEKVKEWNIGRKTMALSLAFTLIVLRPDSVFESTFLLLNIAPFGFPVVPEV
jgi:hypothetical protein